MQGAHIAALLGVMVACVDVGSVHARQGGAASQTVPSTPDTTAPFPQIRAGAALPNRAMRVGDLESSDIYTPRGERLGSVRRIVLNVTDGRTFLVLEHGGVAGLGEKEFPLPVERVYVQGGRLVVPGLVESELRAVADWDVNDQKYRQLADSEIVNISRR